VRVCGYPVQSFIPTNSRADLSPVPLINRNLPNKEHFSSPRSLVFLRPVCLFLGNPRAYRRHNPSTHPSLTPPIAPAMRRLPVELAMEVGSYLTSQELQTCTDHLCRTGVEFVSVPVAQRVKKLKVNVVALITSCTRAIAPEPSAAKRAKSSPVEPQQMVARIELYLSRHQHVEVIILFANIRLGTLAKHGSIYSEIEHAIQFLRRPDRGDGKVVEWHVRADSVPSLGAFQSLHTLDLSQSDEVVDLSALASSYPSLHTLDLSWSKVTDLAALASSPSLHTLDLSWSKVAEVSPLAACPSLHTLKLIGSDDTDLTALASCPSLHTLDLSHSQGTDVSVLASFSSLHTLNLGYSSNVTDVSVLAACQWLHTLDLTYTRVADLTAFASCPSLHTLDLTYTRVIGVAALASCPSLHTLKLSNTKVTDVSALASCPSLCALYLGGTDVVDVSALSSIQSLHTLNLGRTGVADVSSLASCPSLHTLNLSDTDVTDVSPLAACSSLYTLDLTDSKVTDVSALAACPSLQELGLDHAQLSLPGLASLARSSLRTLEVLCDDEDDDDDPVLCKLALDLPLVRIVKWEE
jgi:Leucine-rich repeat (LRR) protein